MNQPDLKTLQDKALEIKNLYITLQKSKGRMSWTASDYMAGFVADVGELSELVMVKRGVRSLDDADEKLAHELCDCLYSILVLADQFDVDLGGIFIKNMDMLMERLEKKGR